MTLYKNVEKRIRRLQLNGVVGFTDYAFTVRLSFTSYKDMDKIARWLKKNYPDNEIEIMEGVVHLHKQPHEYNL